MRRLTVEHLGKRYRLGGRSEERPVGARALRLVRELWGGMSGTEGIRELWALRDVSFSLDPGTVLGVIGPNGAGKTTLLKILARITPPTEGRVVGRGRVVSLIGVGTGMDPYLSGRENVFLQAALYGVPRTEVVRRYDRIIQFAELGDFMDVPLRRYSSGMFMRLAFSVAINMDPDILLADEVLAVGDLSFQERCLERVQEAGRSGLTVLFVSHDMAAVRRICHKVMWLNAGTIAGFGEPEEVASRYESLAWSARPHEQRQVSGGHKGEYGEILLTQLVSTEGREIGAARASDAVSVKIIFRAAMSRIRVRCAVDICAKGVLVLRSIQPHPTALAEAGLYAAFVRIPKGLLADTVYTLNVSVSIGRDGTAETLVEYSALTFRVFDTDDCDTTGYEHKMGPAGVVAPRLEWSVVQERQLAQG